MLNLKVLKQNIHFQYYNFNDCNDVNGRSSPLNSFICSKWTWVECIYVWIGHYAGAILNGIMSVYTGKIYDKYGLQTFNFNGFIILIITTASLSFLKYDSSYTMLVVVYAIRMFAVSLLMMPINTAGINA